MQIALVLDTWANQDALTPAGLAAVAPLEGGLPELRQRITPLSFRYITHMVNWPREEPISTMPSLFQVSVSCSFILVAVSLFALSFSLFLLPLCVSLLF